MLFHHKMEENIKSKISHVIYNFYTKKNNDTHELQMVEQYLENMNAEEIAIPNWKAISTFFMSNRMFRVALIARENIKNGCFLRKDEYIAGKECGCILKMGIIVRH